MLYVPYVMSLVAALSYFSVSQYRLLASLYSRSGCFWGAYALVLWQSFRVCVVSSLISHYTELVTYM